MCISFGVKPILQMDLTSCMKAFITRCGMEANFPNSPTLLRRLREIRRNSIAIDRNDILHMSFIDSFPINPYRLGYQTVPVEDAFSASRWSPVQYINDRGQSYMNEIAVFEDSIHVLYEDTGSAGGSCSECADMFYRRSMDGGINWDTPISFLPTDLGTARPHLSIDPNGDLYASWDEGWDRHSGRGNPEYGVFTFSRDLGMSWSEPMEIRYPGNTNVQLTVEGDGKGGIMLVWRTISGAYPGVYYIWSDDYGKSWTEPGTLPSFFARPLINYFDSYDMVTDSSGHIHLLAAGNLVNSQAKVGETPGLYHFEWDGQRWYPPVQVYNGGLLPEYPRIVIERGNQLHATWFLRYSDFDNSKPHEIMYAKGETSAPRLEPSGVPTIKPITEIVSQVDVIRPGHLTATPQILGNPTLEPAPYVSSRSLYTEKDEYKVLLLSLAPVFIILGTLIIVVRKRQRNMR
jgi:hypothetical protein